MQLSTMCCGRYECLLVAIHFALMMQGAARQIGLQSKGAELERSPIVSRFV